MVHAFKCVRVSLFVCLFVGPYFSLSIYFWLVSWKSLERQKSICGFVAASLVATLKINSKFSHQITSWVKSKQRKKGNFCSFKKKKPKIKHNWINLSYFPIVTIVCVWTLSVWYIKVPMCVFVCEYKDLERKWRTPSEFNAPIVLCTNYSLLFSLFAGPTKLN